MNEILTALHRRKSVRAYTGEPVSAEQKEQILRAACAAPTAGNQQLYTILDITDQGLKDKLAVSCDNQPFIAKAEVVLIFCADCQKWYDAFAAAGCEPRPPRAGDLMLAVTDCAIAAQNAVTAADSLGLGSCYIGDIMEQGETHRASETALPSKPCLSGGHACDWSAHSAAVGAAKARAMRLEAHRPRRGAPDVRQAKKTASDLL